MKSPLWTTLPAPSVYVPYLVDTIGTYTDGARNVVHNGDFIGPLDLPSIKPSGIADVPYTAYNRPVYDAQTALLTHGAFYTNYISIGQRRANTNYNVSFENTKQDGVLRILNGYNRQNFRLNVDQQLTPRMDLSVGGFFGKSTNNKVAEGPGAPFFAVTFIEPYINLFAPNPDGTPYAAVIPHQLPNAAYGVPSGFGANRLMYGSMNVTAKNGAPGPSATLLLVDLPKKPPTDRSILGVNC